MAEELPFIPVLTFPPYMLLSFHSSFSPFSYNLHSFTCKFIIYQNKLMHALSTRKAAQNWVHPSSARSHFLGWTPLFGRDTNNLWKMMTYGISPTRIPPVQL